MKRYPFLLFLLSLLMFSCRNVNDAGISIRPSADDVRVAADSFHISSTRATLVEVPSETDKPFLGVYSDDVYGDYEVDFLTDFHYYRNFTFPAHSASDSLYLVLYYKEYYGDSLSVMEATAYRLDGAKLDYTEIYTNAIDIKTFCSLNEVLGKASYVPHDATVTDSVRSLSGYCNTVKIPMPAEIRNRIMTDPTIMQSQTAFTDFFKGVYVANTYGEDVILDIDSVNLELSYRYPPDTTKLDSLVYAKLILPANKSNTTVVHIPNREDPLFYIMPDTLRSISSPGGQLIFFTMPWERMYERIYGSGGKPNVNINNAQLFLKRMDVMPGTGAKYEGELEPPPYIMAIRKLDIETFFSQSSYPLSGVRTYIGRYKSADSTYVFDNMADYLQATLDGGPSAYAANDTLILFPINVTVTSSSTYSDVTYEFSPTGVILGSGSNKVNPFRLLVTYSEL